MSESRREFLGFAGAALVGAALGGTVHAQTNPQDGNTAMKPGSKSPAPGKHVLAPLPYDYNALEPAYDEATVKLHHSKHHAAYVAGLNKAELELHALCGPRDGDKPRDLAKVKGLMKAVAFHGSGHLLHTIFWTNMKPKGGGTPDGEIGKLIARDFVDYNSFRDLFLNAAQTAEGSGWAILGHRRDDDALVLNQVEKHENFWQCGVTPLLALDVWEHAYYLKYQSDRKTWTETFMNSLVNWEDVDRRLKASRG